MRDEWAKKIPGLTTRCAEHAIRVAAIAAAFSGRAILYAKDLGPASAFAEYQARIRKMLGPNPGENPDARCSHAILGVLDEKGWFSKRDVNRKIHGDRLGPSVFQRALLALERVGDIEIDETKPARIRRLGPDPGDQSR